MEQSAKGFTQRNDFSWIALIWHLNIIINGQQLIDSDP